MRGCPSLFYGLHSRTENFHKENLEVAVFNFKSGNNLLTFCQG